jgi:hypothetical protein
MTAESTASPRADGAGSTERERKFEVFKDIQVQKQVYPLADIPCPFKMNIIITVEKSIFI